MFVRVVTLRYQHHTTQCHNSHKHSQSSLTRCIYTYTCMKPFFSIWLKEEIFASNISSPLFVFWRWRTSVRHQSSHWLIYVTHLQHGVHSYTAIFTPTNISSTCIIPDLQICNVAVLCYGSGLCPTVLAGCFFWCHHRPLHNWNARLEGYKHSALATQLFHSTQGQYVILGFVSIVFMNDSTKAEYELCGFCKTLYKVAVSQSCGLRINSSR